MKPCLIFAAAALLVPMCAKAQTETPAPARKACEDLKSEIAAKLDAKGVKAYTLDIVDKDKDAEGKVVGTCDGGTKKIMYTRGAAPAKEAPAKAAEATKK